MKYFKITDLTTAEDHYISSVLPNETATHVALTLHLDLGHKYEIEEVPYNEFYEVTKKVFEEDGI